MRHYPTKIGTTLNHLVCLQVLINVIDDDVFEEDEHFYVLLSNPRYLSSDSSNGNLSNMVKNMPKLQLSTPAVATVMILDDDHSGVFSFADGQYEIAECSGEYQLKVSRFSGARGRVVLPYKTLEGTARDGVEFEMTSGQIIFDDNETLYDFLLSSFAAFFTSFVSTDNIFLYTLLTMKATKRTSSFTLSWESQFEKKVSHFHDDIFVLTIYSYRPQQRIRSRFRGTNTYKLR